MADLTALILTKNEELNIGTCINSIRSLAKRIIVIDSFSNDNTVSIAKSLGAEVYQHEFENYSKQFKYGLNNFNITTKWVFRIDADESLTEESAAELEKLCKENNDTDINGIIVRFEVNFMGKKLKHGGIYPFRKLLVFKYGLGDIEDRHMDEHIVLFKGKAVETKYDSIHRDYKDLTYWVNKVNWYASREVKDYYEELMNESARSSISSLDKKARIKRFIKFNIYYKLPMGLRAYMYYLYRYYFKLGFLDGKEGKIFAFFHAYWYRYLVDAKIYESEKNGKVPEYSKGLK
jgi:glycosyltransferase involved in cell wall biosynthesis